MFSLVMTSGSVDVLSMTEPVSFQSHFRLGTREVRSLQTYNEWEGNHMGSIANTDAIFARGRGKREGEVAGIWLTRRTESSNPRLWLTD
jgi:hypothetical protein